MKHVYTLEDLRDWQEPDLCYAVLGDPVEHSASPAMHNAALEYLGLPERYCRLHILPEQLAEAMPLLVAAGFKGVNLTIPHKTDVLPLLDGIDEHARRLGAVNTIAIRGGKLLGKNTDGPGIVLAIQKEFGKRLGDLHVLIVGAGGGAGRAISTQCVTEGCPQVILMNRTVEKVTELAKKLGDTVRVLEWNDDSLPEVDLIINTSSVGMTAGDPSPIAARHLKSTYVVYDTIYVGRRTPLQLAADQVGARSANGLSLLLHQGALALEWWIGRPAPLEIMREGLLRYVSDKNS